VAVLLVWLEGESKALAALKAGGMAILEVDRKMMRKIGSWPVLMAEAGTR
jgi:hypothetical protein